MLIRNLNAEPDGDLRIAESSDCQHPGSEPRRRRATSDRNEISLGSIAAAGMIGFTAVIAVVMFTASPRVSSHLVDCFRSLFN